MGREVRACRILAGMPSGRRPWFSLALLAALALLGAVACGGDDSPSTELGPDEWKASVYETVVHDIALPAAQASMPESDKPTIYLATADGSGIGAEVQVLLIGSVKDEADLKIQDDMSDVIVDDAPAAPVRDHGLLVTVSALPDEQTDPVDLTVTLYFDEDHGQTVAATLTRAGPAWTLSTSIPPD